MSSMDEKLVSHVLAEFDLNPIILWEIILRQQYDKAFQFDEETVLYNFQLVDSIFLHKKNQLKLLHLIKKNVVFILTDSDGEIDFMRIMKKYYRFQSCDQLI